MKIMFYNSSSKGSGQFVRSIKLSSLISSNFPNSQSLIVVGNCQTQKQLVNNVDIIRLPEIYVNNLGVRLSRIGDLELAFSLRHAIINSAIEGFRPDILFVDNRPAGLNGELRPFIAKLRNMKCKTILMFRDIIDDPATVKKNWTNSAIYQYISENYDKIIVFGERSHFDALEMYGLNELSNKISHLGYLGVSQSKSDLSYSPTIGDSCINVLVTVGGGSDGHAIIEKIAGFILELIQSNDKRFRFTIVLGSQSKFTPKLLFNSFPISPLTTVFQSLESIEELIINSHVVISMCGYNTLAELSQLGKKIIAVPRDGCGGEQIVRCQLYSKLYPAFVSISESELDANRLENAIISSHLKPNPNPLIFSNGDINFVNFLREIAP